MKIPFNRLYPKLRIPAIVALSFALTWILVYDVTQISFFSPQNKATNFEPGDFYQLVEDSRPVRVYCPEVVLVPVDGLSRVEIASVIEEVAACYPKVIGIDLLWGYPQPDTDSYLLEVLDGISAVTVVPDTAAYIYSDVAGLVEGDVTLTDGQRDECVRAVYSANSISAIIARALRPDGSTEPETGHPIRFGHYEFPIVIPDSISAFAELIGGKAVIIGTLSDPADMHPVPVAADMSGMMIHATGIASLLNSDGMRKSPAWFDWILAIAVCALFIWVNLKSKSWRGGELAMRLFQISFLILILFSGTMIYLYCGLSIDFTRPLLMVAAAAVASDLWLGAEQLLTRKK